MAAGLAVLELVLQRKDDAASYTIGSLIVPYA